MDEQQAAPAEAPVDQAQQQDQGGKNPADVIMGMQKALAGMAQGLQGSPLPPEGLKHLENAMNEYNAFVSIVGKSMGLDVGDQKEQPTMENAPMEAGGNKNAVPAGY